MYSLLNVSEIMAATKAKYAKQWRATRRDNRRYEVLASDYVKNKYPNIHDEIQRFYNTLNENYPDKHNLTKTKEYREWKAKTNRNQANNNEAEHGANDEPEHGANDESEHGTNDEPEQEMRNEAEHGANDEPEHGTNDEPEQEMRNEAEHGANDESEHGTNDEPEQEMCNEAEHGANDEPQDIIPGDLIAVAAQDLVHQDLVQQDNFLDDIDGIINDIVNELRQDQQLRDIMDYYNDEGVGLEDESYIW